MRISRDVGLEVDDLSTALSVLSDVPARPGEELTLALVSAAGETVVRVKVLESSPAPSAGALRHRLKLEIVSITGIGEAKTELSA